MKSKRKIEKEVNKELKALDKEKNKKAKKPDPKRAFEDKEAEYRKKKIRYTFEIIVVLQHL